MKRSLKEYNFNYSKLKGKIVEVCDNRIDFAEKLNVSPSTLSKLLSNDSDWSSSLIYKACEILNIQDSEIKNYFFTLVETRTGE